MDRAVRFGMKGLQFLLLLLISSAVLAANSSSTMTHPTRLIHVSIARPFPDVYRFISQPENMTAWAAGLSSSPLRRDGQAWVADSPMGKVQIKFASKNEFGVVDHEVTLPDGTKVTNPLRVQANGDGTEVIFTLYRMPKVTEADFEKDAKRVQADLAKLKSLLESP